MLRVFCFAPPMTPVALPEKASEALATTFIVQLPPWRPVRRMRSAPSPGSDR